MTSKQELKPRAALFMLTSFPGFFQRNFAILIEITLRTFSVAMSSTEEDSEMNYDSSCSGDSFIDAIEEENGVSRMVIMGLTGLCMCTSLRVHPFLYEMSGGFSSYDLEDLRDSH